MYTGIVWVASILSTLGKLFEKYNYLYTPFFIANCTRQTHKVVFNWLERLIAIALKSNSSLHMRIDTSVYSHTTVNGNLICNPPTTSTISKSKAQQTIIFYSCSSCGKGLWRGGLLKSFNKMHVVHVSTKPAG